MATDIATLGIKVDASQADQGKLKLEELAKAGDKAQASANGLKNATGALNGDLASTTGAANAASSSVGGLQGRVAGAGAAMTNTGGAAQTLAERVTRLKASVDPLGVALDKNNDEMREAAALYASGAINAETYARSMALLNARATDLASRQTVLNARMMGGADASRLSANEALNLSRQFADIGVTAAMGMNPLMILIQQGPQIADIMKTSGLGWREMAKEMLIFFKILEPIPAVNAAVAASNSTAAATATAAAVGEQQLSFAFMEATAAANASTAANAANAASLAGVDKAGDDLDVKMPMRFTRFAKGGLIAVAALATIGTAFGLMANEAEKGLGDVQAEFGFTETQMKRLKDEGVETGYTIGDVMSGTAATIADVFREEIDYVMGKFSEWGAWISETIGGATANMIDSFIGALMTIKENWSKLPLIIGDAALAAANQVIRAMNIMLSEAVNGLNSLISMAPEWVQGVTGKMSFTPMGEFDRPNAGAAEGFAASYQSNIAEARANRERNQAEARGERLRGAAGEGDREKSKRPRATRERKPRESEEMKDYKRAIDGAKQYIDALNEETDSLGKNELALKRAATAREQKAVMDAAAALGTAEAMFKANQLSSAMAEAQDKWEAAMASEKLRVLAQELGDLGNQLAHEESLIGLSNEAREKAIAQRQIDIRLRDLERDGWRVTPDLIEAETRAILDNAAARGRAADVTEAAGRNATAMRDFADSIKETTSNFGELFGSAGQGFADLLDVVLDFNATRAEGEQRLAELEQERREGRMSDIAYEFEKGRVSQQMADAQISHYGNMLSAAKGFFKEGSSGFKVLEAAERAYRIFQFAMQIRAMFMDKAQTVSSVANSGARAAADGVAAIAKAIASLPFPFNLVAGAATAAALVAFGVKVFGGGGGGKGASGSSSATKAADSYSGPRDEYGAPTSYYSVLKPGATTVAGSSANDNRAPAANVGNGGSFRGGDLIIQGGADRRTVEEMQGTFQAWSQQTVEDARRAAAQDRAAEGSRQRIGGA